MKRNKLIQIFLVIFSLSLLAISCGDDDGDKASAGFAGIATTYYEEDGEVTITIPFVNGSVSESDILVDGSATENEDFEILSVTDEGVQIKLMDDDVYEETERLRFRISKAGNGNVTHVVTIVSNNCEDEVGMEVADLTGVWTVVTDEWEDFVPGDHVTIAAIDATHVEILEYPATTVAPRVGLTLTISNLATGAIIVESQDNGSYNASGTQRVTSTGTGEVTGPCAIDLTLNFDLPCCGSFNGNSLVLSKE